MALFGEQGRQVAGCLLVSLGTRPPTLPATWTDYSPDTTSNQSQCGCAVASKHLSAQFLRNFLRHLAKHITPNNCNYNFAACSGIQNWRKEALFKVGKVFFVSTSLTVKFEIIDVDTAEVVINGNI